MTTCPTERALSVGVVARQSWCNICFLSAQLTLIYAGTGGWRHSRWAHVDRSDVHFLDRQNQYQKWGWKGTAVSAPYKTPTAIHVAENIATLEANMYFCAYFVGTYFFFRHICSIWPGTGDGGVIVGLLVPLSPPPPTHTHTPHTPMTFWISLLHWSVQWFYTFSVSSKHPIPNSQLFTPLELCLIFYRN